MPLIIGITGSFGTGKTTVAGMFRRHGFEIINVDRLYHDVYRKSLLLRLRIKKEFGTLDRAKIREMVFSDPKKLKKLDSITHPPIIKKVRKEIRKLGKKDGRAKIAVDVPLLFEAGMEKFFDKIVVVKCGKKAQLQRILKKGKHTKKEAGQIMRSQMQIREKAGKADFVVDNSRAKKQVEKRVGEIASKLKE